MDFLQARPFQIIFVTVFILLAIGSLFLFATFQGHSAAGAKVGHVVIWGVLPASAMNTLLSNFATAHQDYASVSYVQKQPETFDADLAQGIASGAGPDLILISQEQLLSEEDKLVLIPFASIPQRGYLNSYVPEASLFLTSTGTYGVPLVVDPLVLFYNRDMLANVGSALPPSSWEAVIGLTPSLTARTAGDISRSAIALGTYGNVTNARAIISLLLLQAGSTIATYNGTSYQATLANYGTNSTSGSTPAEAALNFYTQFADPAKAVYSWNSSLPAARDQFLAGDSALYVGFASEVSLLKAGNPNLNFDMAAIPQPQTSTTKTTYGLMYSFAIPKATKNGAGALMVAKALSEGVDTAAAHAFSMAPAQRSELSPSSSDLYQAIYYPEALYAKGWLSPSVPTTDSIFATMISDMNSGRLTTIEAATKAGQALQSSI